MMRRFLVTLLVGWFHPMPPNVDFTDLNNWPAIVEAVQGNIIPDFPVINKSFNFSYSGNDL